jgi:hypothetical protein
MPYEEKTKYASGLHLVQGEWLKVNGYGRKEV